MMLVLRRTKGEEIVILALDMTIRLLEIHGDKARIGIGALAHRGARLEVGRRIEQSVDRHELDFLSAKENDRWL